MGVKRLYLYQQEFNKGWFVAILVYSMINKDYKGRRDCVKGDRQ